MKIPKEVTIGITAYQIQEPDTIKGCRGITKYNKRIIKVAKGNAYYHYTTGDRSNTFWHELTHAILHDMDDKLAYDEKFVTAFADRLDQAIKTAKFK